MGDVGSVSWCVMGVPASAPTVTVSTILYSICHYNPQMGV